MNDNRLHMIETLKTILLTLLTISMLVLIVVYIGGTHIYQTMTASEDKRVFDKLWSVQSGQRSEGLDSEHLLPASIVYKRGGEPLGTVESASTRTIYELIAPCVLELFGSGSECIELEPSEGEQLYGEAMSGGEYIYVRYHSPVLYQLIYAYASGKLTVAESDTAVFVPLSEPVEAGAYIDELVIIPEKELAAHRFIAYARDGEGRYYMFSREADALASEFHISKLSEAAASVGMVTMSFLSEPFDSLAPIPEGELETTDICSHAAEIADDDSSDRILRLFGFNPDKISSYFEKEAGIYYDSHSRIRLESGRIGYKSVDQVSGLGLSELLGYSSDEGYGLFDKLAAVDLIITELGKISKPFIGGEATLCLGNVYTDGALLIFEYFYTYDGIRISGDTALRAAFGQDTLYYFELEMTEHYALESVSLCPSAEYISRKLIELKRLPIGDVGAAMRRFYENGRVAWKAVMPSAK